MTDHKSALEHAQQFADSTQSSAHANLCRAYLEQAQRIKESQEQEPVLFMFSVDGKYYTAKSESHAHGMLKNSLLRPDDFPLTALYQAPPIPPTQQEAIDKAGAIEKFNEIKVGVKMDIIERLRATPETGADPDMIFEAAAVIEIALEALIAAESAFVTQVGEDYNDAIHAACLKCKDAIDAIRKGE